MYIGSLQKAECVFVSLRLSIRSLGKKMFTSSKVARGKWASKHFDGCGKTSDKTVFSKVIILYINHTAQNNMLSILHSYNIHRDRKILLGGSCLKAVMIKFGSLLLFYWLKNLYCKKTFHISVQIIHETISKISSWSLKYFAAFSSPVVIPEKLPDESYPSTVQSSGKHTIQLHI